MARTKVKFTNLIQKLNIGNVNVFIPHEIEVVSGALQALIKKDGNGATVIDKNGIMYIISLGADYRGVIWGRVTTPSALVRYVSLYMVDGCGEPEESTRHNCFGWVGLTS